MKKSTLWCSLAAVLVVSAICIGIGVYSASAEKNALYPGKSLMSSEDIKVFDQIWVFNEEINAADLTENAAYFAAEYMRSSGKEITKAEEKDKAYTLGSAPKVYAVAAEPETVTPFPEGAQTSVTFKKSESPSESPYYPRYYTIYMFDHDKQSVKDFKYYDKPLVYVSIRFDRENEYHSEYKPFLDSAINGYLCYMDRADYDNLFSFIVTAAEEE